jgi:hypothetical protein
MRRQQDEETARRGDGEMRRGREGERVRGREGETRVRGRDEGERARRGRARESARGQEVGKHDARVVYGVNKENQVAITFNPLSVTQLRNGKPQVILNGDR